jgi:putative two-component system response regulator
MKDKDLQALRVLVVDDEPANLSVLSRMLGAAGYREVRTLADSRQAMDLFRDFRPDLLLLDLRMPHLDGFEILSRVRGAIAPDEYLPVLVLTGDLSQEVKQRALLAGARDFLTKPFDMTEVLLRIRNLLETRYLHLSLQSQNETLEVRVRERTHELARAQVETLQRLAIAAEYRDDITGRHAERVGLVAFLLARELGIPEDEATLIRRAATLHDVGKIGVPDAILMKPGPLTAQEFRVMQRHTEIGGRILSGSRSPLLRVARRIALSHHERWDGTGYSGGRAGEDIPLVGRIVAVADVFDSLTHERPYKLALTVEDAVGMIHEARGTHFDPEVLDAFMGLVNQGAFVGLDEKVKAFLEFPAEEAEPSFPFSHEGIPSPRGVDPIEPLTAEGGEIPADPRDPLLAD